MRFKEVKGHWPLMKPKAPSVGAVVHGQKEAGTGGSVKPEDGEGSDGKIVVTQGVTHVQA